MGEKEEEDNRRGATTVFSLWIFGFPILNLERKYSLFSTDTQKKYVFCVVDGQKQPQSGWIIPIYVDLVGVDGGDRVSRAPRPYPLHAPHGRHQRHPFF